MSIPWIFEYPWIFLVAFLFQLFFFIPHMQGFFCHWTQGELVPSALRSQRLTQCGPILLMAPQRALNTTYHELCMSVIKRERVFFFLIEWLTLLLTFFCREHSDHTAKLAFPYDVVDSYFHFKLGQRCNAVVSVDISRCIRWCQNCLDPSAAAKWAESHNIAKVLSALLFLRNWLG